MKGRKRLLFGTGGAPLSSRPFTTEGGIEKIRELGLGCMEVEFVRGVKMSSRSALAAGKIAANLNVRLSAHAPYYINLNAREERKVAASREYILQTARIASSMGGKSIAFHAAFYMGDTPAAVFAAVQENIERIIAQLKEDGVSIYIRPEIMGKSSQFGTLDEILELSARIPGVAPVIDFAHWHARTGKANSYDEFAAVLKTVEGKLGRDALDNMHIHVSGIQYGQKGEIRHLNLDDSDFRYLELMKALNDYDVGGLLICESPNLEDDARRMQQEYMEL